ncbi:hypothetical protein TNCV_657501 [Trichonephila clavipes]|nr:hypothetical protein TNCV_657501 [Trichonephila clavipes]
MAKTTPLGRFCLSERTYPKFPNRIYWMSIPADTRSGPLDAIVSDVTRKSLESRPQDSICSRFLCSHGLSQRL